MFLDQRRPAKMLSAESWQNQRAALTGTLFSWSTPIRVNNNHGNSSYDLRSGAIGGIGFRWWLPRLASAQQVALLDLEDD